MCIFAQYKDILGVPREGIHATRLYDFAIVDFVMTFIGACIIAYFFKMNVLFVFLYFIMTFIGSCIIAYFFKINVLFVFLYLFILGEYLHILFCVDTKFLSIFFNLKKNTKNNKN